MLRRTQLIAPASPFLVTDGLAWPPALRISGQAAWVKQFVVSSDHTNPITPFHPRASIPSPALFTPFILH